MSVKTALDRLRVMPYSPRHFAADGQRVIDGNEA
jgi:hypothetical protein